MKAVFQRRPASCLCSGSILSPLWSLNPAQFQVASIGAAGIRVLGMVDRDIGDFQKATVKWAVLTSLVITALALLTGAISLFSLLLFGVQGCARLTVEARR